VDNFAGDHWSPRGVANYPIRRNHVPLFLDEPQLAGVPQNVYQNHKHSSDWLKNRAIEPVILAINKILKPTVFISPSTRENRVKLGSKSVTCVRTCRLIFSEIGWLLILRPKIAVFRLNGAHFNSEQIYSIFTKNIKNGSNRLRTQK